jgi:PPM family protein phosphatase
MDTSQSDTVELPVANTAAQTDPPPATMQIAVDLGAATHQGLVRENNEDSYLVARADRSLELLMTNLPPGELPAWAAERSYGLVVADGMGGQAAGEVASRLALKAVIEHVLATADWVMRDAGVHRAQVEERIAERFLAADQAVHDEAARNPRTAGMGSTMTLAACLGANLFLGHVGDSRAYLLRRGTLRVLTHDHSLAQALADSGVISQEDVAHHHMRNALLRNLGGKGTHADLSYLRLASDDQLLLCTDGLTDMVEEDAIRDILPAMHSSPPPSPPGDATTSRCCSRGLPGGNKRVGLARLKPCVTRHRFFIASIPRLGNNYSRTVLSRRTSQGVPCSAPIAASGCRLRRSVSLALAPAGGSRHWPIKSLPIRIVADTACCFG